MPAFIIQDTYLDKMDYVASRGSFEDALRETWILEEIDRSDGVFDPDKYVISSREYCYSEHSKKCGNCNHGICMLERPAVECPVIKKKQAAGRAG